MKPRVLMLAQEVHPIPPVKGAAVEQWIDAVAHRMTRYEAHIVSVPHPQRPHREVVAGVHYHRIGVGRVYNRLFRKITRWDPWSYTDRVAAYAREIQPAIVHVHNAPLMIDRLAEPLNMSGQGVAQPRWVLHMHNEKNDPVQWRVDALVGCSQYIRNWYQNHGLNAARYDVLPNGVDVNAYLPGDRVAEKLQALREQHGIPRDRFVLLYAGRISPEKGPDLLVDAMRHLNPAKFHLVLVGEWPVGDASSSERVRFAEGLARSLEGLPHTRIGVVSPDRMPEIYGLGDLLVIPSRFEEPFSMVAIEAMAGGVPVLALRRGGMTEYMEDGVTARIVDSAATAEQLAREIIAVVEAPAALARRAKAAREMVSARFDWRQVAGETERLYDDLLR